MADPVASTRPDEIAGFVGKRDIYAYDTGWQYETCINNERRLDYRVHSGIVAGRWGRTRAPSPSSRIAGATTRR